MNREECLQLIASVASELSDEAKRKRLGDLWGRDTWEIRRRVDSLTRYLRYLEGVLQTPTGSVEGLGNYGTHTKKGT